MNIKNIKARVNINYREVIEKIVNDESLTAINTIIWLVRELTILQKYILELLLDRLSTQIKVKELLND